MKGVVFTEFIEMVEDKFSPDVVDEIIGQCELATHGAYTAVGTYDYRELLQLVSKLSDLTATPVSELVFEFGKHLFARFSVVYRQLFEGIDNTFDFVSKIENEIHVEVRKLYPDAELPRFEVLETEPGTLEMLYVSDRPFADLAEGLIAGCAAHFGERITIQRSARRHGVLFRLTRQIGAPLCPS
jgi:hypothetical protein